MFSLDKHVTYLKNYTARKENHGDKLVLAGTMTCSTDCANSVLDEFDPGIRPLLYRKPERHEVPTQGEMRLEVTDGMTARRLPHIQPLAMDKNQKFPGYKIEFESGVSIGDTVKIAAVELHSIVLEALEGGSVRIHYGLNFQVGWMDSGKLDRLIKENIELTLMPPTAEELAERQADLEDAA